MQPEDFPSQYTKIDSGNVAWFKQNYFNVDTASYGRNYAIIFRPSLTSPIHNGDDFTVVVTGLKKTDGTSAEISYQTHFFNIIPEVNDNLVDIKADKQTLSIRVGEAVNIPNVIAHYNGGDSFDVTPEVSLTSNSDAIHIDDQKVIGAKQGEAKVEIKYKGKITALKIDVYSVPEFADVQSHWAKQAIQWALEKRMAGGYSDNTFKPNQPVTEAEFLSMLFTLYKDSDAIQRIDTNKESISNKSWDDKFYRYAEFLNLELDKSVTDRTYRKHFITRNEVAKIIAGLGGKNFKTNEEAIQYLLVMGYATGKNGPSVQGFAGQDSLTRAEAIVFLKNLSEHDYIILGKPDNISELSDNEKNGWLADLTIRAKFTEEKNLELTGNLTEMANSTVTVDIYGITKLISSEKVMVDSNGNFKLDTGPIEASSLNIYVKIRSDYSYYIDVDQGKETTYSYAYTKLN
ncbi:S-layer homology domain-containing protein [Paenibacillus sp. OAE614]|uniref:S-layer homology domain-containing protein n=1 Tax=Paenibacillus sp. OAE614 TaxID=2663804 RepID=UPI0019F28AA2